ncbi:hypothetical protein KCU90_g38, partial [Aureobasidium melanogenum]
MADTKALVLAILNGSPTPVPTPWSRAPSVLSSCGELSFLSSESSSSSSGTAMLRTMKGEKPPPSNALPPTPGKRYSNSFLAISRSSWTRRGMTLTSK